MYMLASKAMASCVMDDGELKWVAIAILLLFGIGIDKRREI